MEIPENILPLIDGDWVLYLACNAIEYPLKQEWLEACGLATMAGYEPPPEPNPRFEDIIDVFEGKIKEIKDVLQTEASPVLFFTGANNFRKELSTSKVYKGNRSSDKPFHYQNLKTYIETRYDTEERDNLEADDLMSIWQTLYERWRGVGADTASCIVTVDKDLKTVNGWFYGPEGHNYGSYGPAYLTDTSSYIELSANRKKVLGTGWRFFYSQILTGDVVDNIGGCNNIGPVKAVEILDGISTKYEAYNVVLQAYRNNHLLPEECLLEMAQLLWMVREYNEDGTPKMWEIPTEFIC